MPVRLAAWMSGLVLLAAAGCGGGPRSQPPKPLSAAALGDLPGLRASPDPDLQAELARIEEEGGTPAQLSGGGLPPETNVAAGLSGLLEADEAAAALTESDEIFPDAGFEFDAAKLLEAVEFSRRYQAVLERGREALARPDCDFGVDLREGFEADLGFVDVVRVCARLEAFQAAELLSRDKPAEAIDALGAMLRWAACLARQTHPVCRMEAAYMRSEAGAVLGAIAGHPGISPAEIERLHKLVMDELERWTPDRNAWIGDRALGLWSYEMVRAGRVMDLLTPEEVSRFGEEGILSGLPERAREHADRDELYYLQTMRRVIQACEKPYYEREELFESVRQDLQAKRNSPQFPVVAGRLLLADLEKGHVNQAQDRANWEGWAVALAAAGGDDSPPFSVNPLTGKPYEVIHKDGLVMVWNVGGGTSGADHPVVLPEKREEGGDEEDRKEKDGGE